MTTLIPTIHRITHQIGLSIGRAKSLGVSQGEAHVLAHLASAGDSTIGELHRAFAHKRSTLTSILDRLSARGLVTRDVSPTDRRSFVVRLTGPGKILGKRVLKHFVALEGVLARHMNERDLKQLVALLGDVERCLVKSG